MTAWPRVMVTGHRFLDWLWTRSELERLAVKLRDGHGTTTAVCGMALGADTAWGEAALAAGLAVEAHVPFPQQGDRWNDKQRARWQRLRDVATQEVVYGQAYSVALLHARNRGMVAASDACIAVWDGRRTGGTWAAIGDAIRAGAPMVHVDPVRRITRFPSLAAWRAMAKDGEAS